MTEADAIKYLAEQLSDSQVRVRAYLSTLANLIGRKLGQDGEDVVVPYLGKFSVSTRAARTGRNPQTGETINIPAKNAVKFKPHKVLRDAV